MSGYLPSWSATKKSSNEMCHDNVAQWKLKKKQWIDNILVPFCVDTIVKRMLEDSKSKGKDSKCFNVYNLSESLEPADFDLGVKDSEFVDQLAEAVADKLVLPPHEFQVEVKEGTRVTLSSGASYIEKTLDVQLGPRKREEKEKEKENSSSN